MTQNAIGYIHDFRSLFVGPSYAQADLADWLEVCLTRARGARSAEVKKSMPLFRRLVTSGGIAQRSSCVPDYGTKDPAGWTLYGSDDDGCWHRPSLDKRMAIFQTEARRLAQEAFPVGSSPPPAIIQVTCTGYEAPTAVQRLVGERDWGQDTKLLHLAHMGCFAAIPATRIAALQAKDLGACSVLHVELCTLHLNLDDLSPSQLVVHHLFADGAIRYDLAPNPPPGPRFALLDTFEILLPNSADEMSWLIGATGFRMTLAREVPETLAKAVPGIVSSALARQGLHRGDVGRWAIHPGGPRVISSLAACLEVTDPAATAHSQAVLTARGNMSSATLPHVWLGLLEDPDVKAGEIVVSLAFGPGLTVTGNVLRKEV